jgi:hypothetical protein
MIVMSFIACMGTKPAPADRGSRRDTRRAANITGRWPGIFRPMPTPRPATLLPLALLALAGCAAAGNLLSDLFRERAPAPLDRMVTASDARLDSLGRVAGSFVGEGTSRAVHLLSSDSSFAESLIRRYVPGIRRTSDFWSGVRARGIVRIPLRNPGDADEDGVLARAARVGSPDGRSDVVVTAITVRAGRCGGRGTQTELVVEPRDRDGPPLTGPVVGTVGGDPGPGSPLWRSARAVPDAALATDLIDQTRAVMDSVLAEMYPAVQAGAPIAARPAINTLADVDAADLLAYDAGDGAVRYAVSLRERRRVGADTLLSAGVVAWDAARSWRQIIFRPTWLRLRGEAIHPFAQARPLFWRRLAAVTDFGFDRDNLWMEQVNVSDGSVLWGIVQPADNVVVAAAEMDGPCQ